MTDHPLDAIFDRFITSPSIFKNHEVLRPSHIPDKLPHRDYEIQFLGKALGSALRNNRPSNMFLYGKTGTGKTIVSKYVTKYLRQRAAEIGKNVMSLENINDNSINSLVTEILGIPAKIKESLN